MRRISHSIIKYVIIILLSSPVACLAQTFRLNAGASFSTIVYKRGAGLENIVPGLAVSGGIDFLETKRRFLSVDIGGVQKGRKDKVTYTDANGTHTRTTKTQFSYGTATVTANLKLSQGNLVPFLSFGPRVEYFIDQPEGSLLPRFLLGANGGIGLMQYAGNWRYGVRADYLYNFTKKPDARTVVLMVFAGFKFPEKITPCPKDVR